MANILVFGGSIVQGYYDTEGGWVDRLKKYYLSEEIKNKWEQSINVFNLGLSGETSNEVVNRFEKETPQRIWGSHEAFIIFSLGVNDSIIINNKAKVTEKEFKKNTEKLIKLARNVSDSTIFLGITKVDEPKVTPIPWSPTESYFNKRIYNYKSIIKKICKANDIAFIDIQKEFDISDSKILLIDGVHPNNKGHKIIFETVKDFLERNLTQSKN